MKDNSRSGMSLLEILVVISLLGILFGLLLTAVQSVRASAAKLACANNLKQIGLAAHNYESAHGQLPKSIEIITTRSGQKSTWSWTITLLPFLEQSSLHEHSRIAFLDNYNSTVNPPHQGVVTVVKVYTCPADSRLTQPITDERGFTAAYGSYWGIASSAMYFEPFPEGGGRITGKPDGAMPAFQAIQFNDITDGTSSTLYIGERIPEGRFFSGNWYSVGKDSGIPGGGGISSAEMFSDQPQSAQCLGPFRYGPSRANNPCDSEHFGSLHTGGSNFVLCDGSVRFIGYSAVQLMLALSTRAGGEVVEVP